MTNRVYISTGSSSIALGIRKRQAVVIRASVVVWTARHFPELFARSSELLLRWKFS